MENIRQAVERAKSLQGIDLKQSRSSAAAGRAYSKDDQFEEVELNNLLLQSRRIISHVLTDPRSRTFDMLRTQVLQSMDLKGWKVLGITSPTPACGKTVTALNLALSIARQPERSVLLVDLDFKKPQVATCLGLECGGGLLNVLEERTRLSSAIVHARAGNQRFMVLPTTAAMGSSELMASRAMVNMLQELKRDYQSQIIILDLPPILTGDDVITILPQIDCVLLVAAVGTSTVADVEECSRHLESVGVVRVVLNKVPEISSNYY